ncbi:MAG: hypothetical protein ACYDA6_03980 [Solirubrobacteraceae bacterium]
MTDFLDQKRSEISKRLEQLRPLIDEYHRLEAAASALQKVAGPAARGGRAGVRRGPGRPRAATAAAARNSAEVGKGAAKPAPRSRAAAGTRRPGRRKGSGARAAQTLELVKAAANGITIPDLAQQMGIKQNYLYRVLPALQKEGKVRKRGRTWLAK